MNLVVARNRSDWKENKERTSCFNTSLSSRQLLRRVPRCLSSLRGSLNNHVEMPRRAYTSRSSDSASSSIHSKPHHSDSDQDSDNDDALLEELEEELDNDFELGGFREKRMMELKAQFVSSSPLVSSSRVPADSSTLDLTE